MSENTDRSLQPLLRHQILDRIEISALRAEFTDAVMMQEPARIASLFTTDGRLSMPDARVEAVGPEQIRLTAQRLQQAWQFFVQRSSDGAILLDGDIASGRTYLHEVARLSDGREGLNYGIYHDRYRHTENGWRFSERVYEVRYFDASPLTGSAPGHRADEPGTTAGRTTTAQHIEE